MEIEVATEKKAGCFQALAALRHRNFRLFWCGQLISLMGTWMQNMAQGWLVLQLTNSPFLLGLVSAIQFTPLLVLALVAGVVADRVPKRRLLIITQSSLMLLAFILGILTLTGVVRYWQVLILAGLLGIVNTFDMPARQSFVVEMVGKKDLMNAIALNSSIFNAARIIGPALAGLVIGRLGMAASFLLNAASFVAVIGGLLLIRVPEESWPQQAETRILEKISEGLNYIRQTPVILQAITLMASLSILTMNFNVLIPVLARNTLRQQAEGYGLLMSASGIGAFGGAVMLAFLSKVGPRRQLLLGGAAGLCFFQLLLAATRSYLLALLLLAFTGWSMITFTASVNTTLQLNVPDNLRGRVMSVYSLVFGGVTPIGSLFSGSIAHLWGAPAALATGAMMGMSSLIIIMLWLPYQKYGRLQ
ncbi:MFS transporter [Neomoorella mulderi]|uniref:Enterobactin exporter EntS n=1 Tax=Moorella mulderi DSM 14980 TaxID=1122241 RepID=A0A151AXE0_9FIRM|nr:MFS transporter [Moorella mulderi]KYH32301.1 enterobactin exporter EntS [Moorella mulderi DSM 14980]